MDDVYMRGMLEGLTQKLAYDDLLFMDLELQDFKIYRAFKDQQTGKIEISKSKITWNNEYGVIDSIKDARFKAFLASDVTSKDMLNYWSNFVLNRVVFTEDPHILDMLRAYTTAQLHSIYQDNKEKLQAIGTQGNTGIIVTGMVPLLLGKEKLLLSLTDGFEISGILDVYFDNEKRALSYAKSYISGPASSDVVLTRKEILSCATKVLIPEVKISRNRSKVIFNGYTDSLEGEKQDIFALSPEFTFIKLPLHRENLIIEGEFKNGAYIRNTQARDNLSFISIPDKLRYDSMVVDARYKPIVYGPDVYSNKLKLQQWFK
ncbi:MAG: hypothetical protein US23_C0023G0004 [candidate division WS6 bacterium GW2011_GWE1_36_69]|nr:MAG: hypothetical protein US23_C0023G0004 [candidate division WS6 bacterium GW2011_GWE1_36_69]